MGRNSISVKDKYEQIKQLISQRIASAPDNFIIGNSLNDLFNYYFSNNYYLPLEIDPDRLENVEIKKERRIIPAHKREPEYQYLGDIAWDFETLLFHVPILPNPNIDEIKGLDLSVYRTGFNVSDIVWGKQQVTLPIPIKGYGYHNNDEVVKQLVENGKQWIYNRLYDLKKEIEQCNKDLTESIHQWVLLRKEKVENDNSRLEALLKKIDIPLRKKEDEALKRIQLNTKPLIQKIKLTPAGPEDYVLNRENVLDIIHVLDNQGRQFEKTPRTYVPFGEEDLRNVLLVNLNAVFEGKATAETFSANGKSDIYLNIDKGNILVFECKIWGGKRVYHETIEQLLGYLTWRHNYGVVIFFSRNKSFANVLSEVTTLIGSLPFCRDGFKKAGDSHFMSQHYLPSDRLKQVEIHHLFYNLYFDAK